MSGNASASPSNVVDNFLFGLLRLRGFLWAFSIRFLKAEDLIVCLSLLEERKVGSVCGIERRAGDGREIRLEPKLVMLLDLVVLLRSEGRFLGAVGAWKDILALSWKRGELKDLP